MQDLEWKPVPFTDLESIVILNYVANQTMAQPAIILCSLSNSRVLFTWPPKNKSNLKNLSNHR